MFSPYLEKFQRIGLLMGSLVFAMIVGSTWKVSSFGFSGQQPDHLLNSLPLKENVGNWMNIGFLDFYFQAPLYYL